MHNSDTKEEVLEIHKQVWQKGQNTHATHVAVKAIPKNTLSIYTSNIAILHASQSELYSSNFNIDQAVTFKLSYDKKIANWVQTGFHAWLFTTRNYNHAYLLTILEFLTVQSTLWAIIAQGTYKEIIHMYIYWGGGTTQGLLALACSNVQLKPAASGEKNASLKWMPMTVILNRPMKVLFVLNCNEA